MSMGTEQSHARDDAIEAAWDVIANAHNFIMCPTRDLPGGSEAWKAAAERWRERYYLPMLRARSVPTDVEAPSTAGTVTKKAHVIDIKAPHLLETLVSHVNDLSRSTDWVRQRLDNVEAGRCVGTDDLRKRLDVVETRVRHESRRRRPESSATDSRTESFRSVIAHLLPMCDDCEEDTIQLLSDGTAAACTSDGCKLREALDASKRARSLEASKPVGASSEGGLGAITSSREKRAVQKLTSAVGAYGEGHSILWPVSDIQMVLRELQLTENQLRQAQDDGDDEMRVVHEIHEDRAVDYSEKYAGTTPMEESEPSGPSKAGDYDHHEDEGGE